MKCNAATNQIVVFVKVDEIIHDNMTFKVIQGQGQGHVRHAQHTAVLLLFWNLSGTTRVSRYQKGKTRKVKTNLDLLEQEIVSGSGICWAICQSAPHTRQPRQHPTTQFFYRPDAFPAAQPTASKHWRENTRHKFQRWRFSNTFFSTIFQPIKKIPKVSDTRAKYIKSLGPDFWISS